MSAHCTICNGRGWVDGFECGVCKGTGKGVTIEVAMTGTLNIMPPDYRARAEAAEALIREWVEADATHREHRDAHVLDKVETGEGRLLRKRLYEAAAALRSWAERGSR